MNAIKKKSKLSLLAPLAGIIIFIILYFVASGLYPGGSQADEASVGFSWLHNYWCNLLNSNAINGQANAARPVALFAMLVLCLSLATFWYQMPGIINTWPISKRLVQYSGIISMVTAMFIFSAFHDSMINIACLLAVPAVCGTFTALYKKRWNRLFVLGLFNLVLVGINNLLY